MFDTLEANKTFLRNSPIPHQRILLLQRGFIADENKIYRRGS
jgi:hypothetical protein